MSIPTNRGYFYVQYQYTGNSTTNATLYTASNPWNSTTSTTAILPTTDGTGTTGGTWAYFLVDCVKETYGLSSYLSRDAPTTNNYIELNNSYVYVYIAGIGGTSQSGYGGGGTGGFAAACMNPTYSISAELNDNNISTSFCGVDWTQTIYVPTLPTTITTPTLPTTITTPTLPTTITTPTLPGINIYCGAGNNSDTAGGASGALNLQDDTVVQPGVSAGSFIVYGSSTMSEQSIPSNIAFCIGGVGGQPNTGSTNVGNSYTTLPSGSPNWISSSTDSSGIFYIKMADGTSYLMPSSPAAENAVNSSILFAIFTPTPST
jgi:hypothetical protein